MTIEDDDIAEMLSGPLSLEGLRQIRPLPAEVLETVRKQLETLATAMSCMKWDLERHHGFSLEVTSQDVLESAKGIATMGNELWATVERETGK